jgi:His-Xaa-Ser system radical SAM maturase HxsC
MYLHDDGRARRVTAPIIGRLTSVPISEMQNRADYIVHANGQLHVFCGDFDGYAGLFGLEERHISSASYLPTVFGCSHLDYLSDGDVVVLTRSGRVNVLYRKSSRHNTVLATEQCNSLCLMCSQPPRNIDDSYRVGQILRLIDLIDPVSQEIGISGGEPTLLGSDFLSIVQKFRDKLPNTSLHILTNGRLFKDASFAARLGAVRHPDLMLGIPLYSDIDEQHDYVVQAKGAFDETVLGLYNLAASNVPIEIRVVLHRLTYRRLPQLAEFICRNFPFADHVALMGLEMFGYVHLNLETVWIDPTD